MYTSFRVAIGEILSIKLRLRFLVWPWCFACAGSSLHGWIHFTMNACAHAVGCLYMTLAQVGCLSPATGSSGYGNRQRRHAGVANSMQYLCLLPGLALVDFGGPQQEAWCANLLALFV